LFQIDMSWFQVEQLRLIALIAIAVAAFLAFAIIWGTRAPRREIFAGREDLIGKTAEVKTVLKPKGTVLIQGELWTAILEEGEANPGDEVVITKVDHLKVWVTKSEEVNR
jgi:membrane-bound serine protease (ClpP class)